MKDEREKNITKLATTAPRAYYYRVQKDKYEIENFEFIKTTEVQMLASRG